MKEFLNEAENRYNVLNQKPLIKTDLKDIDVNYIQIRLLNQIHLIIKKYSINYKRSQLFIHVNIKLKKITFNKKFQSIF